jgi:hypothetical protein
MVVLLSPQQIGIIGFGIIVRFVNQELFVQINNLKIAFCSGVFFAG